MNVINQVMLYGSCVVIGALLLNVCRLVRKRLGGDEHNYRERYLQDLFECCWNGDEADREYAWYRVVQHLRHYNPDEMLINMAEYRREQCGIVRSDCAIVDESGKLKDNNDNPNDMQVA